MAAEPPGRRITMAESVMAMLTGKSNTTARSIDMDTPDQTVCFLKQRDGIWQVPSASCVDALACYRGGDLPSGNCPNHSVKTCIFPCHLILHLHPIDSRSGVGNKSGQSESTVTPLVCKYTYFFLDYLGVKLSFFPSMMKTSGKIPLSFTVVPSHLPGLFGSMKDMGAHRSYEAVRTCPLKSCGPLTFSSGWS